MTTRELENGPRPFVEWLRSLPPGTVFCEPNRNTHCPLAQYLGAVSIGAGDYARLTSISQRIDLPVWAERFRYAYDAEQSKSHRRAIDIAQGLLW